VKDRKVFDSEQNTDTLFHTIHRSGSSAAW
jgi:hypothetical protein